MSLVAAVTDILRDGLPGLFGGTPAVTLTVDRADLAVEQVPGGVAETEPRLVDGLDVLPFDGPGPYTLTRPPASGPRQVRLDGERGRIALRDNEISWLDPSRFTLVLGDRDVTGSTEVRVRYSVIAVHTCVRVTQTIHIGLAGVDAVALERAEALVLALLALEGRRLAAASGDEYADGDYGATVRIESVETVASSAAGDGGRVLEVRTRCDVTATRALRAGDGASIVAIHGPGGPSRRPVDIPIAVDA